MDKQNETTVKNFKDWDDVMTDLERIIENRYSKADSERNHQTFAGALYIIMSKLRFSLV